MTSTAAPPGRVDFTAVWTGTEMIVWGGWANYLNSGGRYNPMSNTWRPVTTTGAPSARRHHTAVWTGDEMVIWGGDNGSALNSGACYDPARDIWQVLNAAGAPSARWQHSAIWTGSEMIVWGGSHSFSSFANDGISYAPGLVLYVYQRP